MSQTLERKRNAGRKTVSLPVRFSPRFLDDADSRIAVVRAIRKRVELLKEHTGADSYQKEMLCLHAAFLHVRLESMETEAMEGGLLDWGAFVQAINSLSGLLKTLGLERAAKNVTDLRSYLSEKNGRK